MEEELKLDQAVPTLTFEPFTETKITLIRFVPTTLLNQLPRCIRSSLPYCKVWNHRFFLRRACRA